MRLGVGYSQSFQLQQAIYKDAMAPDCSPKLRAELAKVWDLLEDRRRIIRGRGLPKPVDRSDKWKPRNPITAGTIGEEPQTLNVPPPSQSQIETVSNQIETVSIKEIPLTPDPSPPSEGGEGNGGNLGK